MSFTTAAVIASWLAIALLAFALSGMLRQLHEMAKALRGETPGRALLGPVVGSRIPDAERLALASKTTIFLDAGCAVCRTLPAVLARLSRDGDLTLGELVIAYAGPRPDSFDPPPGVEVRSHAEEAFRAFNVLATPYGVRTASGRVAASTLLSGEADLEGFLRSTKEVVPR